ncbi:MAG TPA: hypothetical protein VMB05_12200 [Solirubrobacteraceae bacterium]|nr:hypothetical protein [Solirubrobacteraceae bacterium]
MVRLTSAEHRLLSDLAAAEGIEVEALVREALAFPPLESTPSMPHLHLVSGSGVPGDEEWRTGRALPRQ